MFHPDPESAGEAEEVDTPETPIGRTARQLRSSPRADIDWLIPGVAGRGWTILFAGREKIAGKGTLCTYLIGSLERHEATVFGERANAKVTALVFTEEPEDSLAEKLTHFDINDAFIVFDWELSEYTWLDKVEWLVNTAVDQGHGIIYLDNISRAAGAVNDDESGTGLARKIEPLSRLAKRHRITVILDHHNRKSGGRTEDMLRGGTALPGAVENIVAIDRDGDWTSRRRKIYSRGRVKATLWERTIELTEDGSEYLEVVGDTRTAVLATKDAWTAKEFAEAINVTKPTAVRYLDSCEYVEATKEGQINIYRVKATLRDRLEPSI